MLKEFDERKFEAFYPEQVPNHLSELNPELRLYQDSDIECWYAPLGGINSNAEVALFGITPGWEQMRIAYKIALAKKPKSSIIKNMSSIAFAGSMRTNLINMLDALGLPKHMEINSFGDLFGTSRLAYSSVYKYPIFRKGKNYSGHHPNFRNHSFLQQILETILVQELKKTSGCLIIPLGMAANDAVNFIADRANLKKYQILSGFPHPSGANANRRKQFEQNKEKLKEQIDGWFKFIHKN